ncbi:rhodanese-like domain-containing protein [Bdellovibrio sp. NC01]|uniref:rhodanese-like domain-containing protein n=1 Tax=Bdellovibrio sp. NC01 TaxID=2220073 RepID=UPI001158B6F2|nr:rhodanese-like domain-containing protein [Bdellovibrio sp. NC01]QDK36528.1 rhodanese-like domain-containing protein [Bdellovibrio sp. NC01]
MIDVAQIGYFQFDNLVRGRVPFMLINLGVDLSVWYKSVEAMHIAAVTVEVENEDYVGAIKAKKLPPHFAIVVLDQDGSRSKKIADELEAAGFLNAHYVRGGFIGIQKEKNEEA